MAVEEGMVSCEGPATSCYWGLSLSLFDGASVGPRKVKICSMIVEEEGDLWRGSSIWKFHRLVLVKALIYESLF